MERITGNGAPTRTTVGVVGQHYEDLNTGNIYECLVASEHSKIHGPMMGGYIWELKASGEDLEDHAAIFGGGGIGVAGTGESSEIFNDYVKNIASGKYSHAEGYSNTASGNHSHAEGYSNIAGGNRSHVEGFMSRSNGTCSHAEGSECWAEGSDSHAEGCKTRANGQSSHAEGMQAVADGDYAHAEGHATKASSQNQHVQGKYNIEDAEGVYAHIVGNGDAAVRSNAHTLDWDGNAWFAGGIELTSPNGTRYRFTVADDGTLSATAITES